ncbi:MULTISPECIES: thiamine pyrophosphate-dependent enzyme [unclassified Paracoccus (in: a-proteobacteria)]|uniref:thiamine pyrophosphate-dependent enzyme n=2 Tax=Pseudomonadati TaxID=3379134 RepID=UPI0012B3DA7A|nr:MULTISPECIES: indolepyruvate ferredoxin oxidoreductase subunit alpha [unclassified Paracoccus (in: a-proteobacteria)]UXU76428.1 indolepyruvate ferredoxin oxidoreductase subunit alpha [Paracoccus sp. SMMA_5]UXU82234.1 indolepyruvate ferredoxin oxidoreductase subunit alpha [Paracoccus sp. SMMA_5_TC]
MAERSFVQEVQKLRLGAGETFRGEGILAVTKALLENGVGYVGGYQGSPISHLMDVLSDAQDILGELGVHFQASANEATAAAMLAASVHYPIRGAVTFKSTVGTNVASDALANLASGGVTGGALIIVGEDYGEGSSIMQERSHAFAMKSQVWLLDPRPNLPSIVNAVGDGFELSETSNTPVMLQMRIRSCHVHGHFTARDNQRPSMTVSQALENPRRDLGRIVLPPASFLHEQEKLTRRWPAAQRFILERGINERFGDGQGRIGIILQGGLYNTTIRALNRLGLASIYGDSRIDMLCLNAVYPLVESQILEFCTDKDAVLVVEEGQPNFIEQSIGHMLYQAGARVTLEGKGMLPQGGEYNGQVMLEGLLQFLRTHAPTMLPHTAVAANEPPPPDLAAMLPARPPGFCTGCPERPIFAATKLVERELGPHHIASDIGCHLFSIMPPFDLGATTMGYGLGPASASALQNSDPKGKRSISFVGDGGFWHNGLTSSIGNAVFNKNDGVIVIVDNFYSSATGGQDILSSRADNPSKATQHPIAEAVRGMGVKWVRQIDRTYDVTRMRDTLKDALQSDVEGPKVIIASSECMLNRQRREKPLRARQIREGERVVRPRFGIDADICTGDHACMRLSGCPSLSLRDTGDPLRDDPVAAIDQSCVGCGNCGEVADAAVLCPSFYQADVVINPRPAERRRASRTARIIAWLQNRRSTRRILFHEL